MTIKELKSLVANEESEQLEFKKSTGELKGGMETLCGFLNRNGGTVVFGVSADGRIIGQNVSDSTLREVANELTKVDPACSFDQIRVKVTGAHEVLLLATAD